MRIAKRLSAAIACVCVLVACTAEQGAGSASPGETSQTAEVAQRTVRFAADEPGLLWVYYDERGAPHTASGLEEIPADQREHVRIGFLKVDDPRAPKGAELLVADVRTPASDGSYEARVVSREAFDEQLAARSELPAEAKAKAAGDEVVVYGTSWCGACKQARSYLHARGVSFVDKDVERDPGAQQELDQKARAQGVRPRGVPVIDVYGTLVLGFDARRVGQLLAAH